MHVHAHSMRLILWQCHVYHAVIISVRQRIAYHNPNISSFRKLLLFKSKRLKGF